MKRFVWLLLLAFCAALGQVQPVAAAVTTAGDCGCCEGPADTCGMPDCMAQPGPGPTAAVASTAGREAGARELTRAKREDFQVRFLPRPAPLPAALVPANAAPVARVPLFKAHCSFLL